VESVGGWRVLPLGQNVITGCQVCLDTDGILVGIPGYDMRLVRVAAVQMCGQ